MKLLDDAKAAGRKGVRFSEIVERRRLWLADYEKRLKDAEDVLAIGREDELLRDDVV